MYAQIENFMTLQQLEYIIAVDKHRHFAKAAETCGVTQSTLSLMIRKLEEELDLQIFDRGAHPVRPTSIGSEILRQAQSIMRDVNRLKEMSANERKLVGGVLPIGVTPTIAPYILPRLFSLIREQYPEIDFHPLEVPRQKALEMLKAGEIDIAIMSMPECDDELLRIPLYSEKFVAYVSPEDPLFGEREICYENLPRERAWVLQGDICFLHQLDNPQQQNVGKENETSGSYVSGSLVTLMHMVDEMGGYTVIPEMHMPFLTAYRRKRIRALSNPVPMRTVSMFVRHDYVRETLLNLVADAIKTIIPTEMMDEHLMKFKIRL